MNNTELKKMTVTAIFIAIGVLLAPFVSFPFGGARVFPLQHLINVLLSVLVGWRYSTAGAFCISSIRIAMGVGTVLAYPGSMIGAALSGVLYKKTNSIWGAVIGEIVGTGLLGGLIAYPRFRPRFQSRRLMVLHRCLFAQYLYWCGLWCCFIQSPADSEICRRIEKIIISTCLLTYKVLYIKL